MVTDHDVGVEGTAPVSHQVIEVFDGTTSVCATFSLRGDPEDRPQPEVCATALKGADLGSRRAAGHNRYMRRSRP
jgi:hypothetical protein